MITNIQAVLRSAFKRSSYATYNKQQENWCLVVYFDKEHMKKNIGSVRIFFLRLTTLKANVVFDIFSRPNMGFRQDTCLGVSSQLHRFNLCGFHKL